VAFAASHVIGALITNSLIELLYYDRSIIVKSESFNFAQDTARFITMLKGVADLTENQWGYHPLLNAPHPTAIYPSQGVLTHPFDGSDIKLNDGRLLTMGETIFQSHGIIGRGTCVSWANMEGRDENVIVKWSWPAKTRTPEADLVKLATKLAIPVLLIIFLIYMDVTPSGQTTWRQRDHTTIIPLVPVSIYVECRGG
jgi:hypothetical protein